MTSRETLEGKIVVYTALFGGYDTLQEPVFGTSRCNFVCFTDDATLTSSRWTIVHLTAAGDPTLMNRHIKLHPHIYVPEYEISVYVDANLKMLRDPAELVDRYLAHSTFAAPRHHERDCVYDEIQTCVDAGKADAAVARAQVERYRSSQYPEHNGLTENRVLLRRHHDPAVSALMEAWWTELLSGIKRDQACLQVVCWRMGFTIHQMNEDVVCGRHFVYQPHNNDGIVLRFKIRVLIFLKTLMNHSRAMVAGQETESR